MPVWQVRGTREHSPAMTMDGRYAGVAGACSGSQVQAGWLADIG